MTQAGYLVRENCTNLYGEDVFAHTYFTVRYGDVFAYTYFTVRYGGRLRIHLLHGEIRETSSHTPTSR